ncbi:peptide deformylase [Ammoniphilus oxalaticus]|uniref:Peptide deformylase n=1 Tax=Ammoniphilus oxalaticus TaxID=66863 RepID=A0A419SJK3_9BACL|nr:peptide deformylase [Ammoniphilus oxalaticus]RKD24142.1 peptide deformylase [Ammoniphilus oxalaticus]
MGTRVIVKHPDPVLRQKCVQVKRFNANLHRLLDDMAETMYEAHGVGLAAPQVGILKRVIVMDCGDGIIEMINPEIVERDGEEVGPEGCLSIPGLLGDVRRALKVKARGLDRHGNPIEVVGEDLLARCIQHEIDHLNGVLFIDLAEKVYEKDPEDAD